MVAQEHPNGSVVYTSTISEKKEYSVHNCGKVQGYEHYSNELMKDFNTTGSPASKEISMDKSPIMESSKCDADACDNLEVKSPMMEEKKMDSSPQQEKKKSKKKKGKKGKKAAAPAVQQQPAKTQQLKEIHVNPNVGKEQFFTGMQKYATADQANLPAQ
ncbi:hypothetical protein SAMD00019534_118030 [Acytostelium subglobosum LB1]|uniref:hypothetical protein n=1 Tax=Acytostelium subglobosum LB1 TaxID=1410327 RepID=UPI000644F3D1|nr:hypothetical protein SAMD00019534_118030 [Acytostelium subglobosum LB1]GAM28627.1 hypothetical protein SAMD00019534_118030 [Acytostelium subglobosum LB1]|eukprot:XP_012748405.1 hypothetical protein SAMD00019534_118030 [Acytostelium subglobosum LB1]